MTYNFETHFGWAGASLPVRFEYIRSSAGTVGNAPNLLYGPGSKAWSISVTPTYQRNVFFTRTEFSYVGTANTTPGLAFGRSGTDRTQLRVVLETGVIF